MILTNSIQAEQSVIGNMIGFDGDYDLTSHILSVDDFQAERHQLIYQAVIDLASANKPYDLVMVSDLMTERNQISEESCPESYFATLMAVGTSMPRSLLAHAELIKSASLRRRTINVLKQGLQSLEVDNEKLDDVNNMVVSGISNLETKDDVKEVFSVDDMIASQIDRITEARSGENLFIETGFPELDAMMRLKAGNLAIIAARPSQGKSLLAVNMQTHLAKFREGVSVFFSVEMEQEDVWDRLTAAETGIPINAITDFTMNEDQMAKHQRFISDSKGMRFKTVRKAGITVSQIRTHLNRLKREYGKIGSVGVDYLGIMGGIDGDDAVKKIGIVARTLKELGSEFECPVFLLSQLNRAVEKRPNRKPILSDLRDSGNIEEVADIVLMLYRDDYYKEKDGINDLDGMADILITKNRNGKTGVVRLAFEGHMGRFSNLMPHYQADSIPSYGEQ